MTEQAEYLRIASFFTGPRHIIFIDESTLDTEIDAVVLLNETVVALVDKNGAVINWNMVAIAEKRVT